jgi:TonB family protein
VALPSTPAVAELPAPGRTAVDPAAPKEKSVVAAPAAKHSGPRPSNKAAVVAAVPPLEGVAIIPPKLIKSMRAIASPNALQYFDAANTATVTLDAVVDSSGHVNAMKVLSGPASLRGAALDALREYRYKPATQGGKPVAAHVTVTIKFLFEP